MRDPSLFKWRHFEGDSILGAVRWYLRYALRDWDVEELMQERGLSVDHVTVFRGVQREASALDRQCRPHLSLTNASYRVDETYIRINKPWHCLYRAVDSQGQTLDFRLSTSRDVEAAARFFRQVLKAIHRASPRVMTVDQNAAYPLPVPLMRYHRMERCWRHYLEVAQVLK